jgi:hypothetical protein
MVLIQIILFVPQPENQNHKTNGHPLEVAVEFLPVARCSKNTLGYRKTGIHGFLSLCGRVSQVMRSPTESLCRMTQNVKTKVLILFDFFTFFVTPLLNL